MHIPPRLLRAHAEVLPNGRRALSAKERDREARILITARSLMARYSRGALTIGKLALALRMAPATIRRHFTDMDAILGEILLRHLQSVARAMGEVPQDTTDQHAARRAAYFAATRTGFGGLAEAHLLLIRERHTLPPDLAAPVEQIHQGLGASLAGPHGHNALALLDSPDQAPVPRPPPPPPAQPLRLSRKLRRLEKRLAYQEARAGPV